MYYTAFAVFIRAAAVVLGWIDMNLFVERDSFCYEIHSTFDVAERSAE